MYRTLLLACFISTTLVINAQDGRYYMGASSTATSHANVNTTDVWSLFNNPAGLGYQSTGSVLATYQNRLNAAAFQTLGFGVFYPVRQVTPGVSFYRFGDDVFNQQKLSLSVGSKLQIVSLGATISLIQNRFAELGAISTVAFEFGGIAEIVEGFRIGAHVFNINQAQFTENQLLPVVMRIGLSYVPNEYFLMTAEVEKELNQKENVKIGFSYYITEWVSIQSGFASLSQSLSFGVGVHPRSWSINYAFASFSPIGTLHELSISKSLSRNVSSN